MSAPDRDLVVALFVVEHGTLTPARRRALAGVLAAAHRAASRGEVPTYVAAAVEVAVDALGPGPDGFTRSLEDGGSR